MFKTILVILMLCTQYCSFSQQPGAGFTAAFDSRKNAVLIKWQNGTTGISSFVIQRSYNNNTWDDIANYAQKQLTGLKSFYFDDKDPAAGQNYYRLKTILANGKIEFSRIVMVIIGSPANSWVMYPVPVKDMLTLEYRGTEPIKGVINIFIQQASGRVLTKLRCASLNRVIQIPVSNFGTGIYDIRIIVQGNLVWNQRFVK